MRSFLLLFINICSFQVLFSQKVYVFTGNGNWSDTSNWLNNAVPPSFPANGDSIIIDPEGACILNGKFFINNGVTLVLRKGKTFSVAVNGGNKLDSSFIDDRDGQRYSFKKIGKQVWMTENFNYATPGSFCYNDNEINGTLFGRLYNWQTAKSIAPPGWHLPTQAEWTTLINYLGGEDVAGGSLKDTTLWINPNTGATNSSGFAGLPAGNYHFDNTFNLFGQSGFWWSASEENNELAWYQYLNNTDDDIVSAYGNKGMRFSVRFIKDDVPEGLFTDPRDGQVYPFKTFGSSVWMTKNLNYEAPGSICYQNKAVYCPVHGHLYNWNTAFAAVPPGWHLPTEAEWDSLINFLGGPDVAGGAMKDTVLWRSPNLGATNSSGFSAIPGGDGNDGIDYWSYYWTATQTDTYSARFLQLSCVDTAATKFTFFKSSTFSVRCVRD